MFQTSNSSIEQKSCCKYHHFENQIQKSMVKHINLHISYHEIKTQRLEMFLSNMSIKFYSNHVNINMFEKRHTSNPLKNISHMFHNARQITLQSIMIIKDQCFIEF